MKLSPNIVPIAHIPPYRRIDPRYPGRKTRISYEEAHRAHMEGGRPPDMEIYRFDPLDGPCGTFILKEGV